MHDHPLPAPPPLVKIWEGVIPRELITWYPHLHGIYAIWNNKLGEMCDARPPGSERLVTPLRMRNVGLTPENVILLPALKSLTLWFIEHVACFTSLVIIIQEGKYMTQLWRFIFLE